MPICGAIHPDHPATARFPAVSCSRQVGNHPEHTGSHIIKDGWESEWLDWPNESYVPPPPGPAERRAKLHEMASRVPPEVRLARTDDPGTSHEAIKTYSRTRYRTRLGKVADYLVNHLGQWVDAVHFTDDEVGGFAGTRRLRELREDYGWDVVTRQHPDKPNTWQHMLRTMPRVED
jgi:hypothetical protein